MTDVQHCAHAVRNGIFLFFPAGATRTEDARELLYARQKVVVTTKAFGLQAIDLVYIDYKDVEGLRRQAREGALMGFTGESPLCLHLQHVCPLLSAAAVPGLLSSLSVCVVHAAQ